MFLKICLLSVFSLGSVTMGAQVGSQENQAAQLRGEELQAVLKIVENLGSFLKTKGLITEYKIPERALGVSDPEYIAVLSAERDRLHGLLMAQTKEIQEEYTALHAIKTEAIPQKDQKLSELELKAQEIKAKKGAQEAAPKQEAAKLSELEKKMKEMADKKQAQEKESGGANLQIPAAEKDLNVAALAEKRRELEALIIKMQNELPNIKDVKRKIAITNAINKAQQAKKNAKKVEDIEHLIKEIPTA